MSQPLQAISFPLWGSRLIEASAGTGKTWTIAALYLRLVLGHGGENGFATPLRPDQVLVMTFTRAATRELSDRIRARLLVGAQAFRGSLPDEQFDPFLRELLAHYPDAAAREQAAWRLDMAAQSMDDAAVHTIDAWCQRMLREHAFDSGCLFDEELLADEQGLLLEAVQDYWRQQFYPLTEPALQVAQQAWKTLDALLKDVRSLVQQELPEQAGQGSLADLIDLTVAQRAQTLAKLKAGWDQRAQHLQQWLDAEVARKQHWDGRKLQARYYTPWLAALAAWSCGQVEADRPDVKTGVERLTPAGIQAMRKADAPPLSLPPEFAEFEQLMLALDSLPEVGVALRLHAAVCVQQRLAHLKRQTGHFGFADMLQRLDAALSGPQGARLRERIVTQTPVALIDEFQDTSSLQFRLFNALYRTADNDRETTLLLIGDPKQSIYRFRGADIQSYLAARRATTGRHYVLDTNYRSTQALVGAVNSLFQRAEDRDGDGAFGFREANGVDNPLPFVAVQAQGRPEQLLQTGGAVPPLSLVWDRQQCNAQEQMRRFAARCAQQIVLWLNDSACGFAEAEKPFARLRPADIAVLVRTGREAQAVRRELRARAVASVYLSDRDSVFAGEEAADLVRWLRAVAAPTDVRLVRAALATGTLGLSLAALAQLAQDDEAFDLRCEQLRALHGIWQTQGVLTLLRQTLHRLDLPATWLAQPGGERRLTNVLHLAELLQDASSTLDGEQALIRWLADEVQAASQGQGAGGEEQVVRLESDADLVKVVTVHKSKGLEYPVVCLPFAGSFRPEKRASTPFVVLTDDQGERQFDLQRGSAAMATAERDRLREDLRLFYVALTRARHALWLGAGLVTQGRSPKPANARSAAGYVMAGPQALDAEDLNAAVDALAVANPGMAVLDAPAHSERSRLAARGAPPPLQAAPVYSAQFDKRWTIASFSSLVRALQTEHQAGTQLLPRPADDEPAADAQTTLRPAAPPQPWHVFERGAVAGNFLHDQLEWLAGEGFALNTQPKLAERLRQRCERKGRGAQADDVIRWLGAVVDSPLPGPEVALSGLGTVLPEMEFWLPALRLPAADVDRLCRQHLLPSMDRPALPQRDLHGMLMGFADLVFEHEGRFWVLDYKSNQLGPDASAYTAEALAQAMGQHRYDVQAALYLLALHRLLRARLGQAYDPARHLGGAIYLFLRGIDGPARGVLTLAPDLALLEALDGLLRAEVSA